MLVFPEGTFNTTGKPLKEFYDGAFRGSGGNADTDKAGAFCGCYRADESQDHVLSLNPGAEPIVYSSEISVEGAYL